MSIHRTAAKRDANESEIVDALVQAGATVVRLSMKGVCDLLVGFCGQNYLLEVKQAKAKLTPDESEFFDKWEGQAVIVRTVEEAFEVIGR